MIILTALEMQGEGLTLAGFDAKWQGRVGDKRNAQRFVESFGSTPAVCAVIWHDLQTTDIPSARINPRSVKQVKKFLVAMYYLYNYPKEKNIPGTLKICERNAREIVWEYAAKLRALKEEKVCATTTTVCSYHFHAIRSHCTQDCLARNLGAW
jgi:hypothetical protein